MPPSKPHRSRVPLAAAAVATVILVPFIVKDMFGSADEDPVDEIATVAVTTEPPSTTAPPDPEAEALARAVVLDPDWPAKGTSVFGESEAQTRARIKARDATNATPELPVASDVPTTRPVGVDTGSATTDPPPAAPTTAARSRSTTTVAAPPPPPTTAPRPTTPPTTQAPPTTVPVAAAAAPNG